MKHLIFLILVGLMSVSGVNAFAEVCQGFGPQTPRDITRKKGTNPVTFGKASTYKKMNLCNIHFHKPAEHKGRFFSLPAKGNESGFQCNRTSVLKEKELLPPSSPSCKDISPGDTVEVHWVYSSCDVKPGKGLGSCLSDKCMNPQLRVETQVFVLANNYDALDFNQYRYKGVKKGFHQSKSLPSRKLAVEFLGSTTGPSFSERVCSPLQVTWSVSQSCKKLNINTLHQWCSGNPFKENKAHGVRPLVTHPDLLAPIK